MKWKLKKKVLLIIFCILLTQMYFVSKFNNNGLQFFSLFFFLCMNVLIFASFEEYRKSQTIKK